MYQNLGIVFYWLIEKKYKSGGKMKFESVIKVGMERESLYLLAPSSGYKS